MKALDALNILSDLTSSQRGMFTTAQAAAAGVGRLELSRLTSRGHLERVIAGVYRSASAPSFREGAVWAAWLALDPATPAWERTRGAGGAVASHATAAWLQELGEFEPNPITFTLESRKQTSRRGLRLVKAPLDESDITLVNGIPTTAPARTVLDLLRDGEDESLAGSALRDAVAADPALADGDLPARVNALAQRLGHPAGYPLYQVLTRG